MLLLLLFVSLSLFLAGEGKPQLVVLSVLGLVDSIVDSMYSFCCSKLSCCHWVYIAQAEHVTVN